MTPTVSVVTVTKNEVERIAETLLSVNRQTDCDLEHVIIDGRSTDGTVEQVERHGGKHTRLYVESDSGITEAMNRGIRRAEGEILIHLNAGDVLVGTRTLAWVADSYRRRGWRWAIGASVQETPGGDSCRYVVPRRFSYQNLMRTNFVNHQATFLERALFEEYGGFDGDFGIALDYEYWLRIGKDVSPAILPIVVSYLEPYRVASNSVVNYWEDRRARRRHEAADGVIGEVAQLGVRLALVGVSRLLPVRLYDALRSGEFYGRLRRFFAADEGRDDVIVTISECPECVARDGVWRAEEAGGVGTGGD